MALTASVPGSKSMTQRALILGALAAVPVELVGALRCDDSVQLTELLSQLGVGVSWSRDRCLVNPKPLIAPAGCLWCGAGGTTLRFGCCLSTLAQGEMVFDGSPRLRDRPLLPLIESLEGIGLSVRYLEEPGRLPLALRRPGPLARHATIDVSHSSQLASGLLLVAPRLAQGLLLRLKGNLVSSPYLQMTIRMMGQAGVQVRRIDEATLEVEPGEYFSEALQPTIVIEPDWSSAAFLLVAGWILGVSVSIQGLELPENSLQGDSAIVGLLGELSLARAHYFDLRDTPDLLPPLALAALFANHPTKLRGVEHARSKESDRIAVLASALRALGASVAEQQDGLDLEPLCNSLGAELELDCAGDHRLAMAFGVLSLRVSKVRLVGRECVSKSFPRFFEELERLRALASSNVIAVEKGGSVHGLKR